MANWSGLPHDLLVTISERLKNPKSFVAFGAVCKSWYAAAKKEYFKGLWLLHGTPYLMLPVRDGNGDAREFYSLIENKIVESVKVPNFKRKKCLESLGWLLASDADGSMSLVDPFSGVEIQLPHQNTFPGYHKHRMDKYIHVQKMVLSARPSETSDFVLMTICGDLSHLTYWRIGDKAWNRIDERDGAFADVVYHNGQFYAIGYPGSVWVINIDPHDNRAEARLIVHFVDPHPKRGFPSASRLVDEKTLYILETTCDSLFIITRTPNVSADGLSCITTKFQVYEVDMMRTTWKEINSLGTMAVFLGHNATKAVDASTFSGIIKPNHIYFTDDNWEFYYDEEIGGGMDMGVYSLDTGKVEPFYHGELLLSKNCVRQSHGKSVWSSSRLAARNPYLMLSVRDGNGDARELYSLIEENIVASVKVPNFKKKKCLESLGWLLASDEDGSMSLVDPFSGVEIQLPHQNTFPEYEHYGMDEYIFVQKMVLSARPSETSDFVLMTLCGGYTHLTYWRVGDKAWNRIDKREGAFSDVVYHNGQFYAIGFPGYVWVINIDPHDNRAEARIIAPFMEGPSYYLNPLVAYKNLYILRTCDSLFIITRTPNVSADGLSCITTKFEVYEVDMMRSTWKEINSLGTMAVFLGHNATKAVDASTFSGIIKPNHIYFTDDNWEFNYGREKGGGMDMGVYSLDTGKVEPFYHGELLLSKVSPSTWITPYITHVT